MLTQSDLAVGRCYQSGDSSDIVRKITILEPTANEGRGRVESVVTAHYEPRLIGKCDTWSINEFLYWAGAVVPGP